MSAPSAAGPSVAVSVVIPAKDDARQLETCLAVLAAQTRRADEVVVVDNGSSDETASVAAAAGARVVRCLEPGIPAANFCISPAIVPYPLSPSVRSDVKITA